MEFSLFDFAKYGTQWWVAVCGLHVRDTYVAVLHIECDQGLWKIDLMGMRAAYFWWKYR